MKISIVGMGIAGSYLASRLCNSHKVLGYERLTEEGFDAVCAWGTSKHGIAKFAKACGLSFEDYVLHDGKVMHIDLGRRRMVNIDLKGLCTFDKPRFIKDLCKGQTIRYGKWVNESSSISNNDLIIDAAGVTRPVLPQVSNDTLIPCVQYKIKLNDPPYDDFYIKPLLPELSGYLWYFPLSDGYAHVGAGDLLKRHNEELTRFLRSFPCEVVKKTGRPVRITPPHLCEPIFTGKIVGVGESIGTVYPVLGEGIIPSLQCADLLIEHLEDLSTYRRRVLEKFNVYHRIFRFILSRIQSGFSLPSHILDILHIFAHMKHNEKRYGLRLKLSDVYRVLKS